MCHLAQFSLKEMAECVAELRRFGGGALAGMERPASIQALQSHSDRRLSGCLPVPHADPGIYADSGTTMMPKSAYAMTVLRGETL